MDLVKVALSTGIVIESHGKTELSNALVERVERSILTISNADVDLKKIQLLTMLVATLLPCTAATAFLRDHSLIASEHLLLSLRRRAAVLEDNRRCSARSS